MSGSTERTWRLMKVRGHESREIFRAWFESVDLGFAHFLDGALVGHTSFLNDRPEDRVVEIGNTWLNPRAWGTGANTEAKYLLDRSEHRLTRPRVKGSPRFRPDCSA